MKELVGLIKKAPVTVAIVLCNVVVFIILETLGNTEDGYFMIAHGAMNPQVVLYNNDWYRLFTSMFLHFGGVHLANNMFLLLVLGQFFERTVGSVRFLGIYLGSGLAGSFVSMVHLLVVGKSSISAGASGAVFGIIGGLFMVVLFHKGRYEGLSTKKMLLLLALTLYAGFSTKGVDNVDHVGGLITGIVLTFFVYGIPYLIKKHRG